MRVGVVTASRCAFASARPNFRIKSGIRCSSSLSPSTSIATAPTTTTSDYISFIKDVAAARSPEHLPYLLNILQTRGTLTSLLRWPTSPPGMEMPVVEVHEHGVWLLANNVDQFIHRILVEEDASNYQGSNDRLWDASSDAGRKLYKKGDLVESGIADVDTYLLKKVGLFPDLIERKASCHLEKGDQVSALVTGEFYTRNHFPGFGRPFIFHAELLLKVGRKLEAKDAARGALKSPWWTLGCTYREAAEIAEWEDEQIEYIKEKVTEEGKQEDLKKGKAPEQVALDEAAFLLDLASVDGTWDEAVDRVAECYREAGLNDIARFILYKE